MENMYTNKHWEELITTIIDRIGADAFLRLSAAVLENAYDGIGDELRNIANEYTRGTEEEWPEHYDEPYPNREEMYNIQRNLKR